LIAVKVLSKITMENTESVKKVLKYAKNNKDCSVLCNKIFFASLLFKKDKYLTCSANRL